MLRIVLLLNFCKKILKNLMLVRLSVLPCSKMEIYNSGQKNMAKTAKNGVVLDTTSNVQPI